ncbi:DNA-protecting protein DprA [Myxococcota bacterium]|nr:DNA-protecting protein DprA [Myxococcota bacterium]MBU1898748.1 DNA-protecting protein DprA [Myxococcota bacterium]
MSQALSDEERAELKRLGATALHPGEAGWPRGCPHPANTQRSQGSEPVALRVMGTLSAGIALVGARGADPYGLDLTARLARAVVEAGLAVISGGAFGVDAAAHRAALEAGGRTLVVLGAGLSHPSPKAHMGIFEAARRRGAVVSPFPCAQAATRWTFPKRNAWIAGLAEAVIVVQAGRESGALQTARAALKLGRPVWVAPGLMDSPLHEGCHALVDEGARLLTHINAWRAAHQPQLPLDAGLDAPLRLPAVEARALWMAASVEARPLAELALAAGLSAAEAAPLATRLELEGFLSASPGGRYARRNPKEPS